jgi:hypothetical protein
VLALDLRGHGDSETTPYHAFGHFVSTSTRARAGRGRSSSATRWAARSWRLAGAFPGVPSKVVIIEGLGPPPIDMEEERQWTIDGFARIDRSIAGPAGLKDLDAAYTRLRQKNPRLSEQKARELALLGTRAREDGTLEWKFDPMLTTMAVTDPFDLGFASTFWRSIAAPTLVPAPPSFSTRSFSAVGSPASAMSRSSRSPAPATWCTSIDRASC